MLKNEYKFVTTRKVFINEDFEFHSQLTDVDMIEKGLDEDDTLENLEKYFKNALNSVRDNNNLTYINKLDIIDKNEG